MVDYQQKYEKYLSKYMNLLEIAGGKNIPDLDERKKECRNLLVKSKTKKDMNLNVSYMKLSKKYHKCTDTPKKRYTEVMQKSKGSSLRFEDVCGRKSLKPKEFMELWRDVSKVKSC
jgi:hypothetical protein